MDGEKRVDGVTDFLLELRSEEIPARMQDDARQNLKRLFEAELAKAGLKADNIATYATPRRLALIAYGLPLETQAVSEETKGPKFGAPPQALEGFLRKTGLTQDQLVARDGVYFAVVEKPGRATIEVLAEAVPVIIRAFPWPKSMRWGSASASTESLRWVRPLQGIVALFGDDVVACEVEGVSSGSTTTGHRFMGQSKTSVCSEPVEGLSFSDGEGKCNASTSAAQTVSIGNAGSYSSALRAAHVIVDQEERRAIIREGAAKCATDAGLMLVADDGLINENAGLTEWPVPMLGRFDRAFLSVPEEVIQLTARVNQKYFICRDSAGTLANAFICTANIEAVDGGAAIVAGNEKVLAARLSDAKFFWEQDLKIPLDVHAEKLKDIVFHEKLGTVADKVDRVAKLARWLVESGIVTTRLSERSRGTTPSGAEAASVDVLGSARTSPSSLLGNTELADQAERAARLCKADLVTGMVGEFPELQGIMGGYYARAQGGGDAVADAVRDHYKPVGQGDDVPTAPVTVAVSLADKLDTLAGFFFVNEKPTGSKDPFALRRAAIAVIALIVANELRFPIWAALNRAFPEEHDPNGPIAMLNTFAIPALEDFVIDRLKVQQREAGVRHDLIDAVFALGGEDDLVRLLARVRALQAFVGTDEGSNLLSGYKRAANILKQNPSPLGGEGGAERRVRGSTEGGSMPPKAISADAPESLSAADAYSPHPNPSPEGEGLESRALQSALDAAEPLATAAIEAEDFEAAMSALASLRAPIDAFFEGVMVNDPDAQTRTYRLGLLARFRDAVHRVADFSKIEG